MRKIQRMENAIGLEEYKFEQGEKVHCPKCGNPDLESLGEVVCGAYFDDSEDYEYQEGSLVRDGWACNDCSYSFAADIIM